MCAGPLLVWPAAWWGSERRQGGGRGARTERLQAAAAAEVHMPCGPGTNFQVSSQGNATQSWAYHLHLAPAWSPGTRSPAFKYCATHLAQPARVLAARWSPSQLRACASNPNLAWELHIANFCPDQLRRASCCAHMMLFSVQSICFINTVNLPAEEKPCTGRQLARSTCTSRDNQWGSNWSTQ